jgi:hypothetical protein
MWLELRTVFHFHFSVSIFHFGLDKSSDKQVTVGTALHKISSIFINLVSSIPSLSLRVLH